MNIQCIAEHSVDIDLLDKGVCIDVGCRGFQFSEAMRDKGLQVVAFDLEPMQAPAGITYLPFAVSNFNGDGYYTDTKDLQAKHLSPVGIKVPVVNINDIFKQVAHNAAFIDILKLDCEGAEYWILSDSHFQPVPKQISIEFHLHAHSGLHSRYFDLCMQNLLKHYVAVKHEMTEAHGAGINYWNSLFIKKELL